MTTSIASPGAPEPLDLLTEDEVAALGRRDARDDAGFGALHTRHGALPLAAMDVDARVAGIVASIDIAQTFVNTLAEPIEATYIFPLPDRAAVHRFRMEVAGRVIEGVIDERGAAREQYDAAIAAGHRAAITEEERPGVFTLRVGNLMPGDTATVRLSLVGPLPVDDGEVTFRFPLVVAPRYIPGDPLPGAQAGLGGAADTTLVPDASRISPPVLLPGFPSPVRLGVRVALEDPAITGVASSLHAAVETVRDARVIELRPGERLDRDFILRWRASGEALRSSLVCADDADGRAGTFMLTFVPPSTLALGERPRDVVLVLDRSGSMGGWKMVAARRAAARILDTLTSRDRFAVLAFDDVVEAPNAALAPATDRARFAAIEWLAKIDARGGTELAAPLYRAGELLAGGHDDRTRVIALVTDGQVGNEDHILRELAPQLHDVRMFALGIDQAVNAAFLRRLAAAGGGLCELVESEDRLDAVMARVHRRIGLPVATELAIRGAGLELDRASIAPRKLPDVYAGAPVVVFGRYRGAAAPGATIELDGASAGEPLHASIARAASAAPAAWLAASWARAQIRELEDRYAAGAREVEGEIVAISKRHGVLSRFTAFLAVDRSEVANARGNPRPIVQPVERPAGWNLPAAGAGAKKVRLAAPSAMAPAKAMPAAPPPMPRSAPPPISASAAAAPPRASAPPRRGYFTGGPPPAKNEAWREAAIDASVYLRQLAELVRELEAALAGPAPADTAIRRVRVRLAEWVEDVRSVGGLDALAAAVEHEVARIAASLALGVGDGEARAACAALARLAQGAPPPPTTGRVAFWK